MVEKISFETVKNGVANLTSQIQDIVKKSACKDGFCVVFTPHTTGALTITSFWDSLGHEDIQEEIRRLIPTRVDFKHQHDTPEDAAGHVKSVFIGVSLTLMVENGTLLLGHSQGIYFLEFDGPRRRECFVKVV
jgi:secondary thiamine-phosphate synthase enzyme